MLGVTSCVGAQMDFWKTLLVLMKRWYVALPVFAVSLGAAGAAYAAVPMHYESTGVIVLTTPRAGATVSDKGTADTNPLLAFDSSLSISASIVIQSINTPEVVKQLGADKPDHTFVLTGGFEGSPFVSVKTESASAEGSRELVVQVLKRAKDELAKRQRDLNAPEQTYIETNDVVLPTEPTPLRGGKIRGAAVALVLGLAASLGSVFGYESYLGRKRRRDEGGDGDLLDDEPDDDPTPSGKGEPVQRREPDPEPERRVSGSLPPVTRAPAPAREERVPVSHAERTQRVRPAQLEPGLASTPNGRPVPAQANGKPVNGSVTGSGKGPAKPPVTGAAPAPVNGKAPATGAPAVNGVPKPALNGQPQAHPSGPIRRPRPSEEYREPPTVRVKPAQVPPPEPRG